MRSTGKIDVLYLLALCAFVVSVYWWGIRHPGFGPEFAMFYTINCDLSLGGVARQYLNLISIWYRPSAFFLPYWAGAKLFDWHDIMAWKAFHAAALIPACWAVYALTRAFFPASRAAGFFAAAYLAVYPGMYTVVLQTSAFDPPHIVFVVAAALCFWLALRQEGRGFLLLIGLAAFCYAIALTCKESALALPAFLAALAFASILSREPGRARLREARRCALALTPFLAIAALYAVLHIARMPGYGSEGLYRTGFNREMVLLNLQKYPLWIIRVFGGSGDPSSAAGYDWPYTTLLGVCLFGLTAAHWHHELRTRADMRRPFLLMLAWTAIFLAIPVYSGAFTWHLNLALCGYAVLFGVALTRLISAIPAVWGRRAALIAAGVLLGAAGIRTSQDTIYRGAHRAHYEINARLFGSLPLPPERVQGPGLVYIEDRVGLGPWAYGGGNLFAFAYRNPRIQEAVYPAMGKVPPEAQAEWLRAEQAYLFSHEGGGKWKDRSREFREYCLSMAAQHTGALISQKKWPEVLSLVEAVDRRGQADYLLLYHYAFSLQQLGRFREAVAAYERSLSLEPGYAYAWLNLGLSHHALGDRRQGCRELDRARAAKSSDPAPAARWAELCRGT